MNDDERKFTANDHIAAFTVVFGCLISSLDQKTLAEFDRRVRLAILRLNLGQLDLREIEVPASQSGTAGVLQLFLDHVQRNLEQT